MFMEEIPTLIRLLLVDLRHKRHMKICNCTFSLHNQRISIKVVDILKARICCAWWTPYDEHGLLVVDELAGLLTHFFLFKIPCFSIFVAAREVEGKARNEVNAWQTLERRRNPGRAVHFGYHGLDDFASFSSVCLLIASEVAYQFQNLLRRVLDLLAQGFVGGAHV